MIGRVVDAGSRDLTDRGAAMAPAAADTLVRYFSESHTTAADYDLVITGDLGEHGGLLFKTLCETHGYPVPNHADCGRLMYAEEQDVHAGASGCGCIATVFGGHFLPHVESGKLQSVLLMATGALMSKDSVTQGLSIPAVAHLVHIEHGKEQK